MHTLVRAILAGLLVLPLAGHIAPAHSAYKWVDEDGVTHYSQQPPPNGEATVINPGIGLPSSVGGSEGGTTADGDAQDGEAPGEAETLEAFCQQLREEMQVLESDRKVSVREEDDTLTTLEGEARQARRDNLSQRIDEYCSN